MDLEYHPAPEPPFRDIPVDADHRDLYHIGGRALDRHIDRDTLREALHPLILAVDLPEVPPAAEERLGETLSPRLGDRGVDVPFHAGVLLEILVDEPLRLIDRYAELAREPPRPHAVDDAEIDRLRARAHGGRHLPLRHVEHARRGPGVYVPSLAEGVDVPRVPR